MSNFPRVAAPRGVVTGDGSARPETPGQGTLTRIQLEMSLTALPEMDAAAR